MAVRRFEFAFLFLLSSCSAVETANVVEIENKLAACISATNIRLSRGEAIPMFSLDLKVDKPIAECGCKSALGFYTVSSQMDGYRSYIIGGKIGLAKSGHRYIPLSAEEGLINQKRLVVGFACAQPD